VPVCAALQCPRRQSASARARVPAPACETVIARHRRQHTRSHTTHPNLAVKQRLYGRSRWRRVGVGSRRRRTGAARPRIRRRQRHGERRERRRCTERDRRRVVAAASSKRTLDRHQTSHDVTTRTCGDAPSFIAAIAGPNTSATTSASCKQHAHHMIAFTQMRCIPVRQSTTPA
jgi:hypothetical protein